MVGKSVRGKSVGITHREKPRGSGRWRLFFNRGGKSREIPNLTFRTKQAAEETAEKLRARLALGLSIHDLSKDSPPLNFYALNWLDRLRKERAVKENSLIAAYEPSVRRHIAPYFGSRPINEIKPADVRAFLASLIEKGLSEKTARNVQGILSSIMFRAVEDEIINRNPVRAVRYRTSRGLRKKKFNTLLLRELHHLLDIIQTHFPEWEAFFTVLAYTGARLSEIRGLCWSSVHIGRDPKDPRRFIRIERTITGVDLEDDKTKTGKDRSVDLNAAARQALLDHHVEELSKGRGQPDDYVFCRPGGGHVYGWDANRVLAKACALAGLKRITTGDFRHTYITVMLYELEEDLLYVIDQVGHSGVQMILQHYGHPERYHRPEKVDKMAPGPATDRPLPATGPQPIEESMSYEPHSQDNGLEHRPRITRNGPVHGA